MSESNSDKQPKSQRTHKPSSNKAEIKIKVKLGLRPHDPFPRCPSKNVTKLRALEALGDYSHSDLYPANDVTGKRQRRPTDELHRPCPYCCCDNVAGQGTGHYGWGWCSRHEKPRAERTREVFAEAHLLALQQHSFECYAADWMDEPVSRSASQQLVTTPHTIAQIEKVGELAKHKFDLTGELEKVRGITDRFYTVASEWKSYLDNPQPIVRAIDKLKGVIEDRKDDIPEQEWHDIARALEHIQGRVSCPLTETTSVGPMPMSDATILKLVPSTLVQITRASKDLFSILKEQWISDEQFEIWFAGLVRRFDRYFGEHTYSRHPKHSERIIEGIAKCIDDASVPRKGSG